MPRPARSASAFPRIAAVEVVVEYNGGERAVYRIEDPQITAFDRTENGHHLRIRFDVEGRPVTITPRYRGVVVRPR